MQRNNWTSIAKDNTMTGNAGIKGSLSQAPNVFYTTDISSKWAYFSASIGQASALDLSAEGELTNPHDMMIYQKWEAGFPELNDEGEKPTDFTNGKLGYFIPGMKELQWIECDTCFDGPNGSRMRVASKESEYLHARLKVLKNGKWEVLWQTRNIDLLACGQAVIGDFDGDGILEVCVTPWYNCVFFDLATGKEKYSCRCTPDGMESGRAYGLTLAVDIDGDGIDEIMTMSFMENHVTMLKFIDGKMQRLWAILYERGTMNKKSIHQIIREPAADVDRDGIKEIFVVLYNQLGDNLWHTLVLNGLTGEQKYDLKGFYLKEIKQIGDDCFLFGYRTQVFESGNRMQVLNLDRGEFEAIFDREGSFAETSVIRTKPSVGQYPVCKISDLEDSEGRAFFTREGNGLSLYRIKRTQVETPFKTQISQIGRISGASAIEVVSTVSHEGIALLRVLLSANAHVNLSGSGIQLQLTGRTVGDFYGAQPLVVDYKDGVTRVVIQSEYEKIDVFRVVGDSLIPEFTVAGTGTRHAINKGPILADIHGDRDYALIAFTRGNDHPALSAFDKDGHVLWHHPFENLPFESLNALCKGKLTGDAGDDILVFFSRAAGTGSGIAINGRTGETIWQRDEGATAFRDSKLPFGGQVASIADIDGDGENEIAIVFPYHFAICSGKTGETKKWINTMAWSDHELFKNDCQGMYALTAVDDFLGNGGKQYLYAGTNYAISVVDVTGTGFTSLWEDIHPMWAVSTMPGIGDIDGDGHKEVFCPGWRLHVKGHEGNFRCLDARTGDEKWRLPTTGDCFGYNTGMIYPHSPTMTVTSDLNGDGNDECFFGIENELFCVGVPKGEKTGKYLWSKAFPSKISHPVPAVINGQAAIILTCADGRLYMVR
jgi:outer membrane protein assembly factor BamB